MVPNRTSLSQTVFPYIKADPGPPTKHSEGFCEITQWHPNTKSQKGRGPDCLSRVAGRETQRFLTGQRSPLFGAEEVGGSPLCGGVSQSSADSQQLVLRRVSLGRRPAPGPSKGESSFRRASSSTPAFKHMRCKWGLASLPEPDRVSLVCPSRSSCNKRHEPGPYNSRHVLSRGLGA